MPAAPSLPAWLEAGLQSGAEHVTILAQRAYRLRAVQVDAPLLAVPMAGLKRVEVDGKQAEVACGEFVMLHQACRMGVENLPPPGTGEAYRAWVVPIPWRVVTLARSLVGSHRDSAPAAMPAKPFSCGDLTPLLPGVQAYLTAMSPAGGTPDAAQRDHALLGLLLALARAGHDHFLHAQDPSVAARIRLLVAAAPARNWTSEDFELALHMSGATLRRRLAQEETSLRQILRETRLQHGLGLLQSSRRPLKSIALACGYLSVASFSRGFVAQFGVEPGAVSGT
ncbi:AraC family transcriptional regulator [Xylophilus sp. GW821-FHT01B05]